jgi:hypothetical protein
MLKLNLGAADRHIDGFTCVDKSIPGPCTVCEHAGIYANLNLNWPWDTSTVDEIVAYDIVEHLTDRINTMNNMHRVLKPGSRVTIETPNASKGAGFFQDPTHVSPWCMNSFQYFEAGSFAVQRLAWSYGIFARFKILSLTERICPDAFEDVWKITAVLEAVK